MGVRIIFIGLVLGLVQEYFHLNLVRACLKGAMVVPFVLMIVHDCALHRQLCLYLFCLCIPIIAIINIVAYQNIMVNNVAFAEEICSVSRTWFGLFGGAEA